MLTYEVIVYSDYSLCRDYLSNSIFGMTIDFSHLYLVLPFGGLSQLPIGSNKRDAC